MNHGTEVMNMTLATLNKIALNQNIGSPFNKVEFALNVKEKDINNDVILALLKK